MVSRCIVRHVAVELIFRGEGIEPRRVGAKDLTNSNYSSGLSEGSSIIKAAQINVHDQREEKKQTDWKNAAQATNEDDHARHVWFERNLLTAGAEFRKTVSYSYKYMNIKQLYSYIYSYIFKSINGYLTKTQSLIRVLQMRDKHQSWLN